MAKIKLGLIPIIFRDEIGKDFWGVVEKIAAAGYVGIESGQFLERGISNLKL